MASVKSDVKAYLDTVKTVSLATCDGNRPSCRVMEVQKIEDDLKIWFVTHCNSPKVEQVKKDNSACIVSSNHETVRDIRLFGKLELHTDRESKRYVWTDHLAQYFQGGVDDPQLAVLQFVPDRLEFRDMKEDGLCPRTEKL